MRGKNEYKNVYLVVGILSLFVLFSITTFIIINYTISNNSSATIYERSIENQK